MLGSATSPAEATSSLTTAPAAAPAAAEAAFLAAAAVPAAIVISTLPDAASGLALAIVLCAVDRLRGASVEALGAAAATFRAGYGLAPPVILRPISLRQALIRRGMRRRMRRTLRGAHQSGARSSLAAATAAVRPLEAFGRRTRDIGELSTSAAASIAQARRLVLALALFLAGGPLSLLARASPTLQALARVRRRASATRTDIRRVRATAVRRSIDALAVTRPRSARRGVGRGTAGGTADRIARMSRIRAEPPTVGAAPPVAIDLAAGIPPAGAL